VLAISIIALVVAVADRATKAVILDQLIPGQTIPIVPGFFSLVYVRNPGAAFGLLASAGSGWRDVFLVSVSVLAVAGLIYLIHRTPAERKWERFAAAAVIGGALGNLYDRLVYGEVIDFLDVYVGNWHWPAFNVADSAITVGVVILLVSSFFNDDDYRAEVEEGESPPD
jgi:signal peptidase II